MSAVIGSTFRARAPLEMSQPQFLLHKSHGINYAHVTRLDSISCSEGQKFAAYFQSFTKNMGEGRGVSSGWGDLPESCERPIRQRRQDRKEIPSESQILRIEAKEGEVSVAKEEK